ncbi:hypothetical protein [Citricoccus sp. NR2]|uniref:hypothetical protein n=1 Tax=Citricoccus sp. NR2 TaxID=3004095 RepID=UPI0022DE2FAA|nr:hypothetical protein [Citricoccus sp. NR2]WBL20165.1 hypothetical protein O1A05_05655 [Citricoccus sp. NR2]
MNKGNVIAGAAVAALLLTATPSLAVADDNVSRTGNYTVPAGKKIDGNLTARSGTVTIRGEVDGKISANGADVRRNL